MEEYANAWQAVRRIPSNIVFIIERQEDNIDTFMEGVLHKKSTDIDQGNVSKVG